MKVTVIVLFILAVLMASMFFYMQPAGPPPHPTMVSFIEAIKNQDHDKASMYLLTPHNREVYRQAYLGDGELDEGNPPIQMSFEDKWPTYWEIDRANPDPREWIEAEKEMFEWIADKFRINWQNMYLKECKESRRARHTVECVYSSGIWYKPPDRFHNSYRLTLMYEYGVDWIVSYELYSQDQFGH